MAVLMRGEPTLHVDLCAQIFQAVGGGSGSSLEIVRHGTTVQRVDGEALELLLRSTGPEGERDLEALAQELTDAVRETVREVLARRVQQGANALIEVAETWRGDG